MITGKPETAPLRKERSFLPLIFIPIFFLLAGTTRTFSSDSSEPNFPMGTFENILSSIPGDLKNHTVPPLPRHLGYRALAQQKGKLPFFLLCQGRLHGFSDEIRITLLIQKPP
uniref:Uncharacterized protein n=1 Tax=Candidatus Kentrum sp. MB TaxID=2138164 RepID=A0A451BFV1_9GAMM|nr:MAG: hypothetical protein BECKMB1821G_GA0114241_10994 [Candidatus Kentron sp. MB]VFK35064.1 MAG: hypothetical protein BECKMB1821I_GA0114274_10984 [Candidatus Kentron sp. MB]VFK77142.1 MAG: hypothetical protein BECKMB1821H_GA0114242_11034 [Candidatus Kentron sp. MB]